MRVILLFLAVLIVSSCKSQTEEAIKQNVVGISENNNSISLQLDSIKVIEQEYTSYEEGLIEKGFVDISQYDSTILVDLRYASTNNFMDTLIYDSLSHAFMRIETAEKLATASKLLNEMRPGYRFIIYDALRPRHIQFKLWAQVEGTEKEKYVANPYSGSMHNYGCAIDMSIVNDMGQVLDMGSEFDHFGRLAEYRYNNQLLSEGLLNEQQVENRKLLRQVMRKSQFVAIDSEWWHFNAYNNDYVRANFPAVD